MPWIIEHKLRRLSRHADPEPAFVKRLEDRLLYEAGLGNPRFSPVLRWATIATLVIGVGLGTTGAYAYASDGVLPGDALYPIKMKIETLEVKIARQDQRKLKIELKHLQRRLKEDALVMKRFGKLPDQRVSQFSDQLESIIERAGQGKDIDLSSIDDQVVELANRYADLIDNAASMTTNLAKKEQIKFKAKLEHIKTKKQKTFDKLRQKTEQRSLRNTQE